MDEKIDKVIGLAGNENCYQYFTLVVIVFLWINCNFISIVIPFLERGPIINYRDKHGEHFNVTLTNEICKRIHDFHGNNFEIVQKFKYSWVSEYGIECNKVEVGLIGSFAFIGNTAGGLIFSVINKLISHKKILIISSFGYCIATFLCTLIKSHDYFIYLLLCEIFMGLFGNCLCYSSMVIAQEVVSNKKRSLFSSIINVGYSLCGVLYSLAFYFVQDWRFVFYIDTGASFFTLILIWVFIYDSPREYINNKNYKKTMKILEGIASFNGKLDEFRESIKQEEYQEFINEIKGEEIVKVKDNENGEKNEKIKDESSLEIDQINDSKNPDISSSLIIQEKSNLENLSGLKEIEEKNKKNIEKNSKINKINVWSLFKYPSITSKFLILNFLWLGTRLTFNGIAISSKSFPGNFYINIIILFIIESISYCISGCLIEIKKLGRKGSLWIQYILIILTFFLLAFLKLDTIPTLSLNFIARFCICGIEVIYYTYSLELYPTPVRSVAFGINATFGNGGSILAPMLLEFLPNWFFLTLLALFCGLNSFLIIFLPETVGKPMAETIEEMEKLDKEDVKDN